MILKSRKLQERQEPTSDKEYARDLRKIPLIPLADGTWEFPPSKNNLIYFLTGLGKKVPPGLSLPLIDEDACVCPKVRELFQLFGVKECDISDVIERIFDYYTELSSAEDVHLIAQLIYLYKVRESIEGGNMDSIYFVCSTSTKFRRGISLYADYSVDKDFEELFTGHRKAHFLEGRYFEGLSPSDRSELAEWLGKMAGVALVPRFTATSSYALHRDFEWLLDNEGDQVLGILR